MDTLSEIAPGGRLIEGTQGPPNLPALKVVGKRRASMRSGFWFSFSFLSFSGS